MKVSLSFEKGSSKDLSIMVDALRASTTITVALDKFKEIYPVYTPEEAIKIAKRKDAVLAGERTGRTIEGFELGKMIGFREGTSSNKWFYSLEINRDKVKATMREIITELEKRGVQTRAIWGLINEQAPYQGEVAYKMEKAPYYAARILNFPSSTQITKEEIEYVAEQIKEVLGGFCVD